MYPSGGVVNARHVGALVLDKRYLKKEKMRVEGLYKQEPRFLSHMPPCHVASNMCLALLPGSAGYRLHRPPRGPRTFRIHNKY
jgi:hypothetical protein